VFACLTFGAVNAHADAPALEVAKDGHLWLEGDSTLHKYKLNAAQFSINFALQNPAGDVSKIVTSNSVKTFELHVPVAQLTSGEKGLDDNMRQALDAEKNPEIIFAMSSYQTTPADAGAFSAHMKGVLTIAGKQRTVTLDAKGTPSATGVRFVGTKRVLMTDYGVKPPVLMLGTLKTADAIDVRFDFTITETMRATTAHADARP
jgi:polyisoprenoid-binding protein YceI